MYIHVHVHVAVSAGLMHGAWLYQPGRCTGRGCISRVDARGVAVSAGLMHGVWAIPWHAARDGSLQLEGSSPPG